MDIFHQSFRNFLIWDYEIFDNFLFSESVTTSDGYRRGYVSFAHFLLYLFQYMMLTGLVDKQNFSA